jgi:glyoxylase-like metal-dependent hydrolase (beta-lactamase superfamily II)
MQLIAPGVWQLIGFPRHWFNAYLIEDVLIDSATRWGRRRILRQLKGRSLSAVALTHCHPDHQGVCAVVCRKWRVPLACHEGDVAAVEGRMAMQPDNRLMRLGIWFWAGPRYPVKRVLKDGDRVGSFRVVHAPGHTPGHVFFFREADRVVLAGDVLANINFLSGKPGLRLPPNAFSADPLQNRQSVRLLAELRPTLVCFGHGPPLVDCSKLDEFLARLG